MNILGAIFKPLVKGVTSWNEGRNKIKEAKLNAEVKKYEAEGRRWEMATKVEADWDLEAMRQSQYSWKDEWLTIIITLPFVGAFIPVVQDYVMKGFEYISTTPIWYQTIFMGIVAASFGLRWWFNKKNL